MGTACASDAECDDHLRCNGSEICRFGGCRAGFTIRCENAATCVEGTSQDPCSYPDSSPWLVYEADEDTPAVDELYAVKESLLGVQRPIKISAPLPNAPTEHPTPYTFEWSADGRWVLFGSTQKNDQVSTRYYAVRMDGGMPQRPIELTHGLPSVQYVRWSPTGHEALFVGGEGSLYWLHLSEEGLVSAVRLNGAGHFVHSAAWLNNRTVVYWTTDYAVYQVPVGSNPAPAPSPFARSNGSFTSDWGYPSPDGAWLVLESIDRTDWLANVATSRVQLIAPDPYLAWQFSPNSRYLVYATSPKVASQAEVYLMDLQKPGLPVTAIDVVGVSSGNALGTWPPDSSFFTYFSEGGNGHKRIRGYDVLRMEKFDVGYEVGVNERAVGFGPDHASVLYSLEETDRPTDLYGFDREGTAEYYDDDAAGRPYVSAEFAPDGSAALYLTSVRVGDDSLTDMVYQDRRSARVAPSVRVPGDGPIYGCLEDFAPDSKGFVYYRFAPDGARVLYWIDITKQVMAKPLQISGQGRVQFCRWQPVVKATN